MISGLVLMLVVGGEMMMPSYVIQLKDLESCVVNAKYFNAQVVNDRNRAVCFDVATQNLIVLQPPPPPKPDGERVD